MVSENDSSPRRQHDPWNKGRLIGQKRPLKPRDVWTIRVRLQLAPHRSSRPAEYETGGRLG